MTRAQAALEFTLITGFMLMAFAASIMIAETRFAAMEKERFDGSVEDILDVLETEIELAAQAGEGYERTFTLTKTLSGVPYEIGINNNQTAEGYDELWLRTKSSEYLRFIDEDVDGDLAKGDNVIRGGSPITINT